MREIIQVHFASNSDEGLSHGVAGPSQCPTRWCLEKENWNYLEIANSAIQGSYKYRCTSFSPADTWLHYFIELTLWKAHTWPQKLLFKLTHTAKKDNREKFFLDSSIYTYKDTRPHSVQVSDFILELWTHKYQCTHCFKYKKCQNERHVTCQFAPNLQSCHSALWQAMCCTSLNKEHWWEWREACKLHHSIIV